MNQNRMLQESIIQYLSRILEEWQYDVVVCLERRGLALFREAYDRSLSVKYPNLPFMSDVSVPYNDFAGKSVLVFDDCVNTGRHIEQVVKALRSNGASHVNVAVIGKARECVYPTLKPQRLLSKGRYERFRDALSDYLASMLKPIDSDHIYVIGKISPPLSTELLVDTLARLGAVYHLNENHYGLTMLGVIEPKFFDQSRLPWIKQIRVPTMKIRIRTLVNGDTCIFPMVYPEVVEIPEEPPPFHDVDYCLCKKHRNSPLAAKALKGMMFTGGDSKHIADWFLYSLCIQFNLECQLLSRFLREFQTELNEMNRHLDILKVDYMRAVEVFHDPEMSNFLLRMVSSNSVVQANPLLS